MGFFQQLCITAECLLKLNRVLLASEVGWVRAALFQPMPFHHYRVLPLYCVLGQMGLLCTELKLCVVMWVWSHRHASSHSGTQNTWHTWVNHIIFLCQSQLSQEVSSPVWKQMLRRQLATSQLHSIPVRHMLLALRAFLCAVCYFLATS